MTTTTQRIADYYGVDETNGLVDGHTYHGEVDYDDLMSLAEVAKRGGTITRLRLLSEGTPMGRFVDVSYCHATLPGGKVVPVNITGDLMCMAYPKVKGHLIAWAKDEGVFAKGIGLLDESNWSHLRG